MADHEDTPKPIDVADHERTLSEQIQFLLGRVQDLPTRQSNLILMISVMGITGTFAGILTAIYLNGAEAQMELRIQRAVEAQFEARIRENREFFQESIFLQGKELELKLEEYKRSSVKPRE